MIKIAHGGELLRIVLRLAIYHFTTLSVKSSLLLLSEKSIGLGAGQITERLRSAADATTLIEAHRSCLESRCCLSWLLTKCWLTK